MFLPVTLGMEGLQFATDYHEYNLGRISQRDLYRRTASPAIIMIFTVGGGIVGGIIGMQAGGIAAIPAAIAGAHYAHTQQFPFTLPPFICWTGIIGNSMNINVWLLMRQLKNAMRLKIVQRSRIFKSIDVSYVPSIEQFKLRRSKYWKGCSTWRQRRSMK